jgi:tetratricopeptide (TPR) repeat protein
VELERLESEHDNFRGALQFARELDDPRLELQLAAALGDMWHYRSHLREGLERIRQALARDPHAPVDLRGPALNQGAMIAIKQGDFATARELAEEMGELYAGTEDETGVAQSMNMLGVTAMAEGRYADSRVLLEESKSIRERIGDAYRIHTSLHNLGLLAMAQGDYRGARAELGSALALAERHGWEGPIANSLCDLAFAELGDGGLDDARGHFRDALTAADRMGWKENVAYCLVGCGVLAVAASELDRAGHFLGQADRLVDDLPLKFEVYAESARAQVEADLRSRLGADRLEAVRVEGCALSIEAAVSEALAALD